MSFNPSDIRITYDPREEAGAYCLTIDPRVHLVFEDPYWPWLIWLRKITGNNRLAVYKHLYTGRFVLGAWAYSPSEGTNPTLQELESFAGDPTAHWPEDLLAPEVLRARLCPVEEQLKKMHNQVREKKYQEREGKRHDNEARMGAVKRLKKMGMDKSAHDLSIGAVPYVGPARSPDRNEGMITALKELRG